MLGVLCMEAIYDYQFVKDPNDQGAADTVRMNFALLPDANTHQLNVTMDLYFFNDVQNLSSATIGFHWINDNLVMTEAVPSPASQTAFNFILYLYRNNDIDSTNLYDQFQFTSARISGPGLVAGPTAKIVASYQFTLSDWDVLDSLVLDTMRVLGARYVFGDRDNNEYRPYWDERIVIYDANRPILSNIVLSEDTLRFQATEGQSNPPPQTIQITSGSVRFQPSRKRIMASQVPVQRDDPTGCIGVGYHGWTCRRVIF